MGERGLDLTHRRSFPLTPNPSPLYSGERGEVWHGIGFVWK